jgi:hypothetical protein
VNGVGKELGKQDGEREAEEEAEFAIGWWGEGLVGDDSGRGGCCHGGSFAVGF